MGWGTRWSLINKGSIISGPPILLEYNYNKRIIVQNYGCSNYYDLSLSDAMQDV